MLVRDLGSKNGALLGETRVGTGRDTAWRANVVLRVGAHVIALDEPVSAALAELEALPDERVPDAELAPAPPPAADPEPAPPSAPAVRAPAPAPRSPSLSRADLGVALAALAVIALSVVGLVWLLRV